MKGRSHIKDEWKDNLPGSRFIASNRAKLNENVGPGPGRPQKYDRREGSGFVSAHSAIENNRVLLMARDQLKGKEATERANIRWVAANLLCDSASQSDLSSCPSLTAFSLLTAILEKGNKWDFYNTMYVKLLTKDEDEESAVIAGREADSMRTLLEKWSSAKGAGWIRALRPQE